MTRKITTLIGLLILPILLIWHFWSKKQLEHNTRYTITTTIKQIRSLKSGLQIKNEYFVNGKKYSNFAIRDERIKVIYPNGRYLVKYASNHPSICEVLWNKPIPDTLKYVPAEGWTIAPIKDSIVLSNDDKIF